MEEVDHREEVAEAEYEQHGGIEPAQARGQLGKVVVQPVDGGLGHGRFLLQVSGYFAGSGMKVTARAVWRE